MNIDANQAAFFLMPQINASAISGLQLGISRLIYYAFFK